MNGKISEIIQEKEYFDESNNPHPIRLEEMKMQNVAIEKAIKDKKELAQEYDVPTSAIVWIGDNHYIVMKNGKEIRI